MRHRRGRSTTASCAASTARAIEPALLEWVKRAEREQATATDPAARRIAEVVFEAEQPVLVAEVTDDLLSELTVSDRHLAAARAVDFRSMMFLPVKARGQIIGVLSMARIQDVRAVRRRRPRPRASTWPAGPGCRSTTPACTNRSIGPPRRCNARCFHRRFPRVDGLQICVQYQPGSDGAQVGGDWYDVVELEDGSVALSIGDVVGHDLAAAVRMSELRTVLRAETAARLGLRTLAGDIRRPSGPVRPRVRHRLRGDAVARCARSADRRVHLRAGWASAARDRGRRSDRADGRR